MDRTTFSSPTNIDIRPRPQGRRARLSGMAILPVLLLLGGTACSAPTPDPGPAPAPTSEVTSEPTSDAEPGSDAITGHVTNRGDGTPYAGAIVEFRNVYNAELHTETDSNGYYSIPLPPGVYNAFALDLEDMNAGFELVDPSDNPVEVPGGGEVDFEAYPINE